MGPGEDAPANQRRGEGEVEVHREHVVGDHQVGLREQGVQLHPDHTREPVKLLRSRVTRGQPAGQGLNLGVTRVELGHDLASPPARHHLDRVTLIGQQPAVALHDRFHATQLGRCGVVEQRQAWSVWLVQEGCSAVMPGGQLSTTTRTPPRRRSTVKSTLPSPTRSPETWRRP